MAARISLYTSLKTKLTVFTLAIFVLGIWSLAFYVSRVLRDDMQAQLAEQQFSTVSLVARVINQNLAERVGALEHVAARIGADTLADSAALQRFLDNQPILPDLFSGGVFATRGEGTALAAVPRASGRAGLDFLDRTIVAAALSDGRSSIGTPLLGKPAGVPVFDIAVPIRDARGRIGGALVGVVALNNAEFLDHLTQSTFGRTGGFYLVARKERLIVTASRKDRIMQPISPRGEIPAIDRFIDGYEGTQIYINPFGVEVIASAKALSVVDWGVSVSIPTEEAFAPIRDMQQRMLVATIVLTLLAGLLTWWMLKRQLSPLLSTAKTLAQLSASEQTLQDLPVASEDEIGELIGGFNTLLAALEQRKNALKQSEQQLFMILESVDAFIYLKDAAGRYQFANRRVRELFGASMDEIVGHGDERFFGADTAAQLRGHDARVLQEGITLRAEETNVLADGSISTYLSVKLPLRDEAGEIYALCGISTDITERKRLEDQVRHLAFYDPLTNLPNRRLLQDRLRQAVAANRRSLSFGALMFVDLDNFKPLNDMHGHELGDLLLVEAAQRLLTCVRQMDTVARFGGDEFVVMLPQLTADAAESAEKAEVVAEKIREMLSLPYLLLPGKSAGDERILEYRCTASIGVTLFDNREADQDEILKRADRAMYQAKESGRNAVEFAAPVAAAPAHLVQLVWHASYECGNALIDVQHRGLLDTTNRILDAILADAPREQLATLIDLLIGDVVEHFKDEESIISAAGFPGAAEHAAIHRRLVASAESLVARFHSGDLGVGELFEFLACDVVARHMLNADRAFYEYLASAGQRD